MKIKNLIILCAMLPIVLIAFFLQGVFAEELAGKTASINLNTAHPYITGNVGEIVESFEVRKQGATFIIVHFSNFSLNDSDYVEIRDANGILKQVITNDDPGKTDLWAFLVDGDTAFVNLISGSTGAQAYGFDIDQYGYGITPLRIESTCEIDDKVDIECVSNTPQYERARSVGRMYYKKDYYWYLCTGSLISQENHFLSNEHCINSQSVVNTLQVRFNYQKSICGGNILESYDTFYGDTFLVSDYDYDLSLMTLSGNPQATYGYLELDPRNMALNETVYIPQHPGGRPKMYDSGPVVDTVVHGRTFNSDFGHLVDTEGGSSGAPVISMNDHKVVGLHHWGGCTFTDGQNQAVLMKNVYPIIEPYLTGQIDPIPYIKANGSDGPISITTADNLSVKVALDSGSYGGDNADWWLLADTPFGWYYYDINSNSWLPGQTVTYQGQLFDLSPYEVLNMSGLPAGNYTCYFGVDINMNETIDFGQLFYNDVEVNVTD